MARSVLPRVVIAGLAGDTGKTLVSLGMVRALTRRQLQVAPFKKGPDYIDAAWLGAAAGVPGRNLDTFLMSREAILGSLSEAAMAADVAVVEGNRGLFDGLDVQGTHSTAELAKLLRSPVVLVVDATKTTRTVAAQVKGCQALDPELALAAVVLNRVGTGRQEALIRQAIGAETGLPVLGAIPRLSGRHLPSRHLGLMTAVEHPSAEEALEEVAEAVQRHTDVTALVDLANKAGEMAWVPSVKAPAAVEPFVKIGILRDRAFSFYYPENLSALQKAGAELVSISPLADTELAEIDGLYAGGGFPELYAAQLSANHRFRQDLAARVAQGLPVWAECGGLMYLSRALVQDEATHPMVGVLPVVVEQTRRPQGHGYVQARVDKTNPFIAEGAELRGHEFHYSRVREQTGELETVLQLQRGIGVGDARDGIRAGSVVAAYTHLHASGTPEWAKALVRASSACLRVAELTSGRNERGGCCACSHHF